MTHCNQILPGLLLALAASGAVQAQCPAGEASYEHRAIASKNVYIAYISAA
jgi:hypothetical protein